MNIGLRGMLTAQTALEVLGHNMTNANTPGYSRQRLTLSASRLHVQAGRLMGNGVVATGIERISDNILSRRIVSQTSVARGLESALSALRGVESLFDPSGHDLGDQIDDFFLSAATLSTDPTDQVRRNGMVQSAQHLNAQFHQMADSTAGLRRDSENRVESLLSEVNALANEVVGLNQEISRIESGGVTANDLRDRRHQVLTGLANLADIRYTEHQNGSVTVTVSGHLLAGHDLSATVRSERTAGGGLELFVGDTTKAVDIQGGEIGGLLRFMRDFLPQLEQRVDDLARNMVLEINRAHSTGVPPSGGFTRLTGWVSLADADGDGSVLDTRLSDADLPFAVTAGELMVHVTDDATGDLASHRLQIDPAEMTVGDFLEALNGIDGISASTDYFDRIQILADGGKRFDFSRRIDAQPDDAGAFGGGSASIGTREGGPFELISGSTLELEGTNGPFTVTFNASDFDNIGEATAAEIAAAINADGQVSSSGLVAKAEDGFLYLQTSAQGATAGFTLSGGSAITNLGLIAGAVTGSDVPLAISMGGVYTGDENQELIFRPLSDGIVGTTPGLQIEVRTTQGQVVGVLDVGENYLPGTDLDLGDGLTMSLGVGSISATNQDSFVAHVTADADTSDVLVGLGLNSFFRGTDAKSIEVASQIASDPSLIATSATGAEGDNGALLDLMALQSSAAQDLGSSFGEFYSILVGDVGFDVVSTESAAETELSLVASLQAKRDQISAVNVDEELVNMIKFEQAFAASARFIQVIQDMQDTILRLI